MRNPARQAAHGPTSSRNRYRSNKHTGRQATQRFANRASPRDSAGAGDRGAAAAAGLRRGAVGQSRGNRAAGRPPRKPQDLKGDPGRSGPAGPAPLQRGMGSIASLAVPAKPWPTALRTGLCLPQVRAQPRPWNGPRPLGTSLPRLRARPISPGLRGQAGKLHFTGRCGFSVRFRRFGVAPKRHIPRLACACRPVRCFGAARGRESAPRGFQLLP